MVCDERQAEGQSTRGLNKTQESLLLGRHTQQTQLSHPHPAPRLEEEVGLSVSLSLPFLVD